MDTSTVLEIIKMIDTNLNNTKVIATNPFGYSGLIDLRNHLQKYIESQLSIAENSTGE